MSESPNTKIKGRFQISSLPGSLSEPLIPLLSIATTTEASSDNTTSPRANAWEEANQDNDRKIRCAVFGCLRPRWKMGYCGHHFTQIHVYEMYNRTSKGEGEGESVVNNVDEKEIQTGKDILQLDQSNRSLSDYLPSHHVLFSNSNSKRSNNNKVPFARLRFEIARSDKELQLGEQIGMGKHGEMIKGKLHGQDVTIKVLRMIDVSVELDIEEFRRDVEKMKSLRHPNIVQFMDVCWIADKQALCIIEEYLPNGSLKDLLISFGKYHSKSLFGPSTPKQSILGRNNTEEDDDLEFNSKNDAFNQSTETEISADSAEEHEQEDKIPVNVQRWTWKRYLSVSQDIGRGLNWLHHRLLTHNNLKPTNVLLTAEYNVKISDFVPILISSSPLRRASTHSTAGKDDDVKSSNEDFFEHVNSAEKLNPLQDTYLPGSLPLFFFQDPFVASQSDLISEETLSTVALNQKSDVFCFGSILYEMLAFCHPKYYMVERKEMDLFSKGKEFLEEDWRPHIPGPPFCLTNQKALIEKCWQKDPQKRPSIDYVMSQLSEMEHAIDDDLRKALEDQIANWELSEKIKDMLLTQLEQMQTVTAALSNAKIQLNQAYVQLRNAKKDLDQEEKLMKQTEGECEEIQSIQSRYSRLIAQHKSEIAKLRKEIGEDYIESELGHSPSKSPYAEIFPNYPRKRSNHHHRRNSATLILHNTHENHFHFRRNSFQDELLQKYSKSGASHSQQ
jgi:serine/threonine protein kinase